MKFSHAYNSNPRDLAKKILENISDNKNILKVEIAGPGFINFFIVKVSQFEVIEKILKEQNLFGKNNLGLNQKVLIEFVSANPTGPLHVGHGRGAAFGDCLSSLLQENGYDVTKEYYVNDAGKQIDILTLSVLQRYHELIDSNSKFEYANLYKGDYIWDIAAEIHRNLRDTYMIADFENYKSISIDDYISNVKNNLSEKKFKEIKDISVKFILDDIKKTLKLSGINFDSWFLESSLIDNRL